MARPFEWTGEVKQKAFSEIIERISEGESVRYILSKNRENLPSNRLFLQWISEDAELGKQYAYATELRAEKMADEILSICDATEDDIVINDEGIPITNHNVINRDRLRVDTRKWLLSKLHPKKYGDSSKIEHSGEINLQTETHEALKAFRESIK